MECNDRPSAGSDRLRSRSRGRDGGGPVRRRTRVAGCHPVRWSQRGGNVGGRWQRLAAIKAQYDPANLFRFNQNIPPAKG